MSLSGDFYSSTQYTPRFQANITYSQTGRNASSATYRVAVKVRMSTSGGWYGYGLNAKVTINGVTKQLVIKNASPTWRGDSWQGTWNFDITASAGMSGGTLPASFYLWSPHESETVINTGSKTVSVSTWNTAPKFSGAVVKLSEERTFPENVSNIKVDWGAAVDNEKNTITYKLERFIGGVFNKAVYTGTGLTATDNIGTGNQGVRYSYKVTCSDPYLTGNYITSSSITKNVLTPASPVSKGVIGFDSTSFIIDYSGASNTNGNNIFTYKVTSSDIEIYNGDTLASPATIEIYKGGDLPKTPYIKFDDIKKIVEKSSWKGSIKVELTTKNTYGSLATNGCVVNIDLRTNPVPPTKINLKGTTSIASKEYYIPSRKDIVLSWSGAEDKLGGALTYDLYVKIGASQYVLLKSDIKETTTTVKLAEVKIATDCIFKAVAKTSYLYSAEKEAEVIKLHYYNSPKILYSKENRTATTYEVEVKSEVDTSIEEVKIISREYTGIIASKKITFDKSPYKIQELNIKESDKYEINIIVKDNSGLQGEDTITKVINVVSYTPILSITRKGIGINAEPQESYKFNLKGNANIIGNEDVTGSIEYKRDENSRKTKLYVPNDDYSWYDTTCESGHYFNQQVNVRGEIYAGADYSQRVYHKGNKPTVEEIGGLAAEYGGDNVQKYWKFNDGLMIITMRVPINDVNIDYKWETIYAMGKSYLTLPAFIKSFIEVPAVSLMGIGVKQYAFITMSQESTTTTWPGSIEFARGTAVKGLNVVANIIAIGRWK